MPDVGGHISGQIWPWRIKFKNLRNAICAKTLQIIPQEIVQILFVSLVEQMDILE